MEEMLHSKLPLIKDAEGDRVPAGLGPVVDAHVHVFPSGIFSAVWQWFDIHAWTIRYQMRTARIFEFLLARGVAHVVALQYAHKPGIAEQLNRYMAEKCRAFPGQVTGLATVFPGEQGAEGYLQQAFDEGLEGLKLHVHVQCFDINGEYMKGLYDCCQRNAKPLVIHAGREPKSPAYPCDPYELCRAEKVEAVLQEYPDLKVCVPHLGFDEMAEYRRLAERYDNLWLDTTMVLAGYFPLEETIDLRRYRPDRVMYGTDFPNIPYAWDRELKRVQSAGLDRERLTRLLSGNAAEFFGLSTFPVGGEQTAGDRG
jgi:predicted TIM-barrel fold metal-dependent hydrolase